MRYWREIKNQSHMIKYLTPKKFFNYLRYKNNIKHRNIITSSFPSAITFQSSAYCNSNCQLCPVGLGIEGCEKGFLKFNKFKQIIDETKKYLIKVYFGDWGEPFLNPDIFKMIKYAEENNIATAVSTNFHCFKHEDDLIKLLDSGLSYLILSLHGVSQKTYEVYQPDKSLIEIFEKIKNLTRLKKKMKKEKPVIELVFAITKKNQHEIEQMQQFTKNLGVNCDMYTASLNLRFYLGNDKKIIKMINEWAQNKNLDLCDNADNEMESKNKFYETIIKEQRIDLKKIDELGLTARHFCKDPWKSLVVNWDGTVSLCCVDYYKYVMGDTSKESIIKIWNNKKYENVRKFLRNAHIEKNAKHPCKDCIRY